MMLYGSKLPNVIFGALAGFWIAAAAYQLKQGTIGYLLADGALAGAFIVLARTIGPDDERLLRELEHDGDVT